MSRAQAKKTIRGEHLQQQMKERGILVQAVSMSGLAEEAGFACENISEVVETVDWAGITKKWRNSTRLAILRAIRATDGSRVIWKNGRVHGFPPDFAVLLLH
jgi:hypothetical protein